MELIICIFLSTLLLYCDALTVLGSSHPLIVHHGGSVLLPCFVNSSSISLEDLEVEWKQFPSDTLVNLWRNEKSRPEFMHEDYRDRVNFFTEEVPRGNFSILITNVTYKDVGLYSCNVFSHVKSGETQIELKVERFNVTGGRAVSSYVAGDVTLNCSVDFHINPEEIEELTWKKVDQNMLVLLFQNGEVFPDSTDDHYKDRVELFSSEINKGNFSLRLKDIKTEDKGLYSCKLFYGEFNDSATVELQELGFSSLHICICFLCGFSLISLLISFTVYKCVTDESRKMWFLNLASVIVPNILLVIAFILWGRSEGTVSEALTCSALSLIRIIFFFWISPHFTELQALYQNLITAAVISLEYLMISIIFTVDYFAATLYKVKKENRAGHYITGILIANTTPVLFILMSLSYALRRKCQVWIRMLCIVFYDVHRKFLSFLLMLLPPLLWYCFKIQTYPLIWLLLIFIWQLGSFLLIICQHIQKIFKEGPRRTHAQREVETEMPEGPRETHAQREVETEMPVQIHKVLWFSGSVILVSVNALALLIELFLKTLNGERSVDLQLILLISESVFTLICLIVAIMTYCKRHSISLCCFSQKKENPPEPDPELLNLS